MELKKRLRPTMTKANAPYRGSTSSLDYVNMINEAIHDMTLLGRVLDEDRERGVEGQSTFLRDNLNQYMNGSEGSIHANIPSSSTMYAAKEDVLKNNIPLARLDTWGAIGDCTVTTIENGFRLGSQGVASPSGIQIEIDVEPGDIIMMKFAISKRSGFIDPRDIKFGSPNVNRSGIFHNYPLSLDNSIGYVDKVVECLYRETIQLQISLLHDGFDLNGGEVDFLYPEIRHVYKKEVGLIPINQGIKERINALSMELKGLSNQGSHH